MNPINVWGAHGGNEDHVTKAGLPNELEASTFEIRFALSIGRNWVI